jgi:hypothetical protein
LSGLQEGLELSSRPALDETGVWIVAVGEQDAASINALCPKAMGQLLGSLLTAAICIAIEGEITIRGPLQSCWNCHALR